MSITEFQRDVCRIISRRLRESGESYLAGGVALNVLVSGRRVSRDIDLFHDTAEALETGWRQDRRLLEQNGYRLNVLREAPTYKEAVAEKGDGRVLLQWTRDSAFRFFPLVEHELLGLTLHPFDLAANKVLALAGRLEPRDWIDVHECHAKVQPFGYLVWASCGKDPGFNPRSLLAEAGRSGRYTQAELNELDIAGRPPDARELGENWHGMLKEAEAICALLPAEKTGTCVLSADGNLYRHPFDRLKAALAGRAVRYHYGSIKGTFPTIRPA